MPNREVPKPFPASWEWSEPEVLSVEDWAEIRRLHRAEKMPIKAIARMLGISRNMVRAAIARPRRPGAAG